VLLQSELLPGNRVTSDGGLITVDLQRDARRQTDLEAEVDTLCKQIIASTGGAPAGEPSWRPPGAVSHEAGTMRMDTDPGRGVVDPDLRVHGQDNLYVCDLSVFPNCPAANPSLTLAALALRLADHLEAA
jgi:choline dehydrogenase-like flavoprotein